MLLKSRASPDMLHFSLCKKKRLAIWHMNRPLFSQRHYRFRPTTSGSRSGKDLPAPPRNCALCIVNSLKYFKTCYTHKRHVHRLNAAAAVEYYHPHLECCHWRKRVCHDTRLCFADTFVPGVELWRHSLFSVSQFKLSTLLRDPLLQAHVPNLHSAFFPSLLMHCSFRVQSSPTLSPSGMQ